MQATHLAAGIVSWWHTQSLKTWVPGGLWYGPVADDALIPYAALGVTEGEYLRVSDGSYIQTATIQIDCYGNLGPKRMGDVAARIDEAFEPANYASLTVPPDRTHSYRCMDVFSAPAELQIDPARKDAKEMTRVQRAYTMQIQGTPI